MLGEKSGYSRAKSEHDCDFVTERITKLPNRMRKCKKAVGVGGEWE